MDLKLSNAVSDVSKVCFDRVLYIYLKMASEKRYFMIFDILTIDAFEGYWLIYDETNHLRASVIA